MRVAGALMRGEVAATGLASLLASLGPGPVGAESTPAVNVWRPAFITDRDILSCSYPKIRGTAKIRLGGFFERLAGWLARAGGVRCPYRFPRAGSGVVGW